MISPANLLRDLPDARGGEITEMLLDRAGDAH